ncbi:MAG: transglycosylase domain-containing protein [Prevotellaceae bacterium]|nr:transglycosylase domain-containing protein [Prevotellaceae bacterium]
MKVIDYEHKTVAKIESILYKIYPWQSLSGWWLAGDMTITCFCTDHKAITNKTFTLPNIVVTLGINRKRATILIETNGLSFLSNVSNKKDQIEVLSELSLNWNSYISIMGDNLICTHFKDFSSSTPVSANAILRIAKANPKQVWFNASIKSDEFELSNPLIDKQFLLNTLFSKFGSSYFSLEDYTPYEKIPEHLINAIICTEDPNFLTHKGIDIYGINLAIAANLKSKKFEKGASTITMQLVRNLFLNHNKNILRKIEEGVVSLLLENYFKIEKKDIIELYLNLIEFAPNVYGLHNASRFYFDKPCHELSLSESLVLTYIIPRPKHFYDALLQKKEQLQNNLHQHIRQYASVMLRKWLISYNEHNNISNKISFSAPFDVLTLPDFKKIDINILDIQDEYNNVGFASAAIILDNGHGNDTLGKRSPVWDDGTQLLEYEFNRDIVKRIAAGLQQKNIRCKILVSELEDIGLEERCKRANIIANEYKGKAILISIHANGGERSGWECFTSAGKTDADDYAKILCEQFRADFGEWIMRFSGPYLCRKENFHILKNVNCPAILSENFFMDTEKDCRFIMSENGRERIATAHVKAIKRMLHLMSSTSKV